MKNYLACGLVLFAIFATACSSEPSSTSSENKETQSAQPKAQAAGTTITAFLRGAAPDAAAAKAFEQGMSLAASTKSPPAFNLNILDRSQGEPTNAALSSQLSAAPLVVYWQTSNLVAATQTLKQANVIAVPVWNVTKNVAALGTKVFGFGYSSERSFAEFAKFAGKTLKSYRFAVLSTAIEPLSSQSKAFIEETKSQGNTVVFEEKIENAEANFKDIVTRAKKENCDTIIGILPGDALVAFIKAARAASYKGKILVGDTFYSDQLTALGAGAEGIHILQAWSDDSEFKKQYTAKFGNEPDGILLGSAALGFDLIRCIEAAGPSPDAGAIAHAWLSTPCEGLTGKTQFSGERIALRQKRILTVKGGKLELAPVS